MYPICRAEVAGLRVGRTFLSAGINVLLSEYRLREQRAGLKPAPTIDLSGQILIQRTCPEPVEGCRQADEGSTAARDNLCANSMWRYLRGSTSASCAERKSDFSTPFRVTH